MLQYMKHTTLDNPEIIVKDAFRDFGHGDEEIRAVLVKRYGITEQEADEYIGRTGVRR